MMHIQIVKALIIVLGHSVVLLGACCGGVSFERLRHVQVVGRAKDVLRLLLVHLYVLQKLIELSFKGINSIPHFGRALAVSCSLTSGRCRLGALQLREGSDGGS